MKLLNRIKQLLVVKKYALRGEEIPKGYGVAWYDFHYDRVVCYPFGLHLVVGFLRSIYIKLRVYPHTFTNTHDAFWQGYSVGRIGIEKMRTVIRRNHEWHEQFDEAESYSGSDLCNENVETMLLP